MIFQSQSSKCKRCSHWPRFHNLPSEDAPLQGGKARAISPFTPPRQRPRLPDPLPFGIIAEEHPSTKEGHDTDDSTFQVDFDDYGSAPIYTQETLPALNTWTFDSSGFLTLPNWASTWKDHGYRLPPDFNQVSSKKNPTDYISRLLPHVDVDTEEFFDTKEPPTPSENGSVDVDTEKSPTPSENGSFSSDDLESTSKVKDNKRREPISMGVLSMLDEAGGASKTKESYNVFVCGKTRADDFIRLDLEQDHVPLTREQIAISVDIDSILWVTRGREFSSKGAINLHLKPHFTNQLPFSANPSVYVTLFRPPSDEAELKNPKYRPKVRLPLSHIPHMTFGHFGEATQQFNLYVFFPRMVHRNENNNRAITVMPQELRELWLSEAVFKALAASMDPYPGTSEYIPHSLEQVRWRTGGQIRQPTLPVSPSAIASLLASLHHEVSENNVDLLSRFGSFFFVLDARGIKMLSKQHTSGEDAFQVLRNLVPSLDWEYMLDRTKGELYLDLGTSFHPINVSEPMVGLWRLSNLRSSYALMGYSKRDCKEYSHNTMQDYGGMKAETSNLTKHHTHVVKRISYDLTFEVVRKPGETAYVSNLDDMIRCNQRYLDGCKRWVQLLEGAENHSYGVRDEIRASAHVVTQLLPVVIERVLLLFFLYLSFPMLIITQAKMFLEGDPIIWIPAKTFFQFSSRRLIELHNIHCKLALTRPDNYGTLTALILHLMRAVMVNSSDVASYVRSALNRLCQRRVMERFGIFFVDDLDLDNMERIDGNLGLKDECDVIRDHKAALAARCAVKTKQGRGIQLTESHITEDYPWGETIPWGMLQRLCKQHPVDFLRQFDFHEMGVGSGPSDIIETMETLFIAFTQEVWMGMHEAFLPAGLRPRPNNLKESMEVWTCKNILARLGEKCTFFPSSHGLDGAPKTKESDVSFRAMRSLFFPIPDKSFKANTLWAGYSEQNGYIGKYWEVLEMYRDDPDRVHALHQEIDQIFEQVQCLPQSKADSTIWHASQGSVCFFINPCYYRIRAVSTTARKSHLGPQRPQVSLAELQKRLDPYHSTAKKRKRNLKKKLSMKQKNHCKPPQKRQ